MNKLKKICAASTAVLLILGFAACSNASSGGESGNSSGKNSKETSVKSDRLILEAVDNGIKVTIIGEAGWGKNTWVSDVTSYIDIFVTSFDSDNKASFVYPFTKADEVYQFQLYNQGNGSEYYSGKTLTIKATGGAGYPMSDAFKNTKVTPSHDKDGKFFLKFDTSATKFGDFFKVDVDLFTNRKNCSPSFGGGILFGYSGVCSMTSYANVYMYFSSEDADCVSGRYRKADNTLEQCDNLFEKMKTTKFEAWIFRDNVKISDFNNVYCAKYELQLWPNDSDIHYWIHSDYSKQYNY